MKKNNNSLLITILGGAIFCFVCLGMFFLFSGSTKRLNSSYESPLTNAGEHEYVNDEVSLGDSVCTSRPCVQYQCSSGNLVGSRCYKSPHSPSEGGKCGTGESYSSGQCHDATGTPATCVKYECRECIEGYSLQNGECVSDPVITCTNPTYNGSSQTIATCANGSIISGATATDVGSNYTVTCQGSKLVSKNCSIKAADPIITCLNPEYNGKAQTIATCTNGSITSGATATAAGDYTVTCQGSKLVSKNCSITAATGCEAGQYYDGNAASETSCVKCPNGYTSDAGGAFSINECYVNAGLGKQVASVHSSVSDCPIGTYSDTSKRVKYGDTKLCTSCGEGKTTSSAGATSSNQCINSTDPEIICLNPKFTGASQKIAECKNGTITSGGMAVEHGSHVVSCQGSKLVSASCPIIANEGVVCCCTKDKDMCSWQKSCNASKPSPVQGVTTEQACKAQESGAIPDKCSVSASISSVATSVADDGVSDPNSYYTVTVKITGKDCGGQTVSYTASNGKPSPTSYRVSANALSVTTSFYVRPETPCADSSATARLTNGSSSTVTLGKDSIRTDWKKTENVCEKNPQYTAFYLADMDGANVYYSNKGTCKGGGEGYTVKWERYLCGSGGGGTPSTPTPPPTPQVPYCYKDSNGAYYWSSSPQSGWKKIDTISKEENCKDTEDPACYLDSSGVYVWGKYALKDGYTIIPSMDNKDACKAPVSGYACYIGPNGEYKWADKAPEGYSSVAGVKAPVDCAPVESPACYSHGDEYVWGNYSKVMGYYYIENLNDKSVCKKPETDACYKDSKGNYVWGKYGNDSKYTLVPSVTDVSQCKNEVPVPKTASDVSKMVYVFMAVLMACGIGFIYYSSVVKKSNQ